MPFQNHRQDRPESAGMDGWDYLIVTASNDSQASAYRSQLDLRRRMGLLGVLGRCWSCPIRKAAAWAAGAAPSTA